MSELEQIKAMRVLLDNSKKALEAQNAQIQDLNAQIAHMVCDRKRGLCVLLLMSPTEKPNVLCVWCCSNK